MRLAKDILFSQEYTPCKNIAEDKGDRQHDHKDVNRICMLCFGKKKNQPADNDTEQT